MKMPSVSSLGSIAKLKIETSERIAEKRKEKKRKEREEFTVPEIEELKTAKEQLKRVRTDIDGIERGIESLVNNRFISDSLISNLRTQFTTCTKYIVYFERLISKFERKRLRIKKLSTTPSNSIF